MSTNNQNDSKSVIKLVVVGVIAVLALVFIFSNSAEVTASFFGMQIVAPGWVWFAGLLVAGVIIGSIFPWFRKKK